MSPYCGSSGYSGHTAEKQAIFKTLFGIFLNATKNLRKQPGAHPEFVYFDTNAGPGEYEDGAIGSPVIALELARRWAEPIRAFVYEQDDEKRDAPGGLCDVLQARGLAAETRRDHTVAPQDARRVSASAAGRLYGIVYCDPNPDKDLIPVDVLSAVASTPRFERVEILIYVSATNYGRVRRHTGRYLLDDIATIPKRLIYLRRPVGQHRWTFALLTNWPRPADWLKRYKFVLVGTPEGDELARDLNLTRNELRALVEAPLFDGAHP